MPNSTVDGVIDKSISLVKANPPSFRRYCVYFNKSSYTVSDLYSVFFVVIPLLVSVATEVTCLFSTTDFIDFIVSFPNLYSSALAVFPVTKKAIIPPKNPNTNIQATTIITIF